MDFYPNVDIDAAQARAIAAALHDVAAVDGLHPRELRLIAAFSKDAGGAADASMSPETLAGALPNADLRLMFMRLALLLAHAEGGVSDAERALIGRYAGALGVSDADMLGLEYGLMQQMEAAVAAQ